MKPRFLFIQINPLLSCIVSCLGCRGANNAILWPLYRGAREWIIQYIFLLQCYPGPGARGGYRPSVPPLNSPVSVPSLTLSLSPTPCHIQNLKVMLCICSAWEESHAKRDNSWNLTQKMRTWIHRWKWFALIQISKIGAKENTDWNACSDIN